MKISFTITFDHPTYTSGKTKDEPIDRFELMSVLADKLADFDAVEIRWSPTLQPPMHDGRPLPK